jgi:hypothetical protein
MTDTMTSQNIVLSSWDTLYIVYIYTGISTIYSSKDELYENNSRIQSDRSQNNRIQSDRSQNGRIQSDRSQNGRIQSDRSQNSRIQLDRSQNSRIQSDRSQNTYTNYKGIKNNTNSNYWNTRETGYNM